MCTFVNDVLFDTGYTVENDGSRTAFDIVDGGLDEGGTDGDRDGVAVDGS